MPRLPKAKDWRPSMKRAVLTLVALTLAAGPTLVRTAMPADQEKPPPVARITGGDALVKEKGRFDETWLHPDESLHRYSNVYLWNVAFQYREQSQRQKSLGTESSILRATGRDEFPIADEHRARFEQVVSDAFVKELSRSKKFDVVDEVGPETVVVRDAVMDIVTYVPPKTARVDVYLSAVGEAIVAFEMIDPETGLMQARIGDRRNIQPPKGRHDIFATPANFNAVWPDVDRWARAVAKDLRSDLEKRLKKKKEQ